MGRGIRFVNRQPGAGTRVWLDAQLRSEGVDPQRIEGYNREVSTHSAAAHEIAQEQADVALAVETAAIGYGLDFVPLTRERYDLVIPYEQWDAEPLQDLVHWLCSAGAREAIGSLGGYELEKTGTVRWLP
jgi:putative molybdopterin biosynthesis protein